MTSLKKFNLFLEPPFLSLFDVSDRLDMHLICFCFLFGVMAANIERPPHL